jgi:hypothetical protein
MGVLSYGLIFACIESAAVFLGVALLGFLISARWDEAHRIALLSTLVLVLACWAIYAQAYFVWNMPVPGALLEFISRFAHPLRALYILAVAGVLLTILPPAFLVLRNPVFFRFVGTMIDRLSLLTGFYLALDVLGLVIVIVRNV